MSRTPGAPFCVVKRYCINHKNDSHTAQRLFHLKVIDPPSQRASPLCGSDVIQQIWFRSVYELDKVYLSIRIIFFGADTDNLLYHISCCQSTISITYHPDSLHTVIHSYIHSKILTFLLAYYVGIEG